MINYNSNMGKLWNDHGYKDNNVYSCRYFSVFEIIDSFEGLYIFNYDNSCNQARKTTL